MKTWKLALMITGILGTTAAVVSADVPDWPKHPNLVNAWKGLETAFDKLTAAQKANDYQLGGHAAKAKELCEQAAAELKLARNAANTNKGNPGAGDNINCPSAPDFPKHPNLTAAGAALASACTSVVAAQKANEYDMEGHAAKAKGLIGQAMTEIVAARDQANKN
jgi:hypothetical protein